MEYRERRVDPENYAKQTLGQSAEIVGKLMPEGAASTAKDMALRQFTSVFRAVLGLRR
jgi:hypothetical protein